MTLQEWRRRTGLSQKELADRLGVSSVSVSRYEGGRIPEPDVMARIYEATDGSVAPNDFYGFPKPAVIEAQARPGPAE